MTCPQCRQEVEPGAAFCGNCGQPLMAAPTTAVPHLAENLPPIPLGTPLATVPQYALSTPEQHTGETKALLSIIFGIIGLTLSFIPLAGLFAGVAGLMLGTMTRQSHRKRWSTIGIIFSCLAIAVALAFWTFAIVRTQKTNAKNHIAGSNTAVVATSVAKTACYNASFGHQMNTDYDKNNGCDMRAYDGTTIITSNDVYKIYANQANAITDANFANVAKAALEKDVSSTLPEFTIDSERTAEFAGSPAYIVNASDSKNKIAVVEAAVLHKVGPGYNLFSLVHATKGSTTDLKALESQWQWK